MKKILAIVLAVIMVVTSVSVLSGCGNNAGKDDPKLIGVALNMVNADTDIIKTYLTEEIGPAFNLKFEFSEVVSSADQLVAFIENEYAKGAVGIINTATTAAATGIAKCKELGMYMSNMKSALDADFVEFTNNLGNCGASKVGTGDKYKEAIKNVLGDGKNHSIIIYSCSAVGRGAESHFYSAIAILETMQEMYNLKYDRPISEIAESSKVGELVTGNPDVKIYLVPGLNKQNAATSISQALQTGDYDTLACVAYYSSFMGYVDEVEKSTGKNIKVIATASIEPQTKTGFSTKDSTGDFVLNAAIINPKTIAYAYNIALMRNALDGNEKAFKDDGKKAHQYFVEPWICMNAKEYEGISKLDTTSETYVVSVEDIKNLIVANNPSANLKSMEQSLLDLGDVQKILAKRIK